MWLLEGIGFIIDDCAFLMAAAQLGGKPVDSSFYEAAVAELRRRWGKLELLVVRYLLVRFPNILVFRCASIS